MKSNFKRRICIYFVTILMIFSSIFIFVEAKTVMPAFKPAETNIVLNNPYMGWVPWASGGPYSQPHRLVYINVSWADLEPEKGKYAFKRFEAYNKFEYWRSKDIKIILRINMDYPGSDYHIDIPQWLYDEIQGDGIKYDIPYGKGFSPNYENPKLISYHEKLIQELATRYNDDGLIPIIAIGSLGHWGEFHTWKSNRFAIPFPTSNISDLYVTHYIKAFSNKTLLMRRPFKIAKSNNIGLFNDSFGDPRHTYDLFIDYINNGYRDFLTGEMHPSMPDYWKYAPSGGEVADFPGIKYFQDDKIEETLQQIKDSHISWLGPSFPPYRNNDGNLQRNSNLVLKTMGYRFVLKSVSHGYFVRAKNGFNVDMEWENKGVAPFYYKWPLEISLSDSKGNIVAKNVVNTDIRNWLPGKTTVSHRFVITQNLKGGRYTLCVAIIDPATGKPGIDLAIEGRRPDGRYSLDNIQILKMNMFR